MRTLCDSCPKYLRCGVVSLLESARKHGANVVIGYEEGDTFFVVRCSSYREVSGNEQEAGGCHG